MLIETSALTISNETIAAALAKGVKYAKLSWLEKIKVHALQRKPAAGVEAYADPACIAAPFLFRVEIKSASDYDKWFALDNARLAKGCARMAACDPMAFGRILTGKGKVEDCMTLLQYALFGMARF